MHIPPMYRAASPDQMRDLIRSHPLGLLLTNGTDLPYATNLPVIGAADSVGELAGATLFGHMNRVNPHWSALRDGMPGKLVISGPGAYISPAVYLTNPAAPTWNFASVHLLGVLHLISDLEGTLAVVRRTAALLETAFGEGWDPDSSVGYFRSIVRGVGAFEFRVESAEGMFKLSQEKPPEIQQNVIDWLRVGRQSHGSEIGRLMTESGLGTSNGH